MTVLVSGPVRSLGSLGGHSDLFGGSPTLYEPAESKPPLVSVPFEDFLILFPLLTYYEISVFS